MRARPGRRRAAAALLAGLALLPAACSSGSPSAASSSLAADGPRPPASGAWFGAWVEPDVATQEGRIAAVDRYEQELGRPVQVVHDYHPWTDPFPSAMDEHFAALGRTVLLSWAATDSRRIASGADDALIRARARQVKAWGAPVLLRYRWEMDRPNLAGSVGSPAEFLASWRHTRAIFAAEGVRNAAWVWCPLADGFATGRAQRFYPGDDEVDWLCADVYATDPGQDPQQVAGPFLAWAAHRRRPVVLGEVGVTGGTPRARAGWVAALADLVVATPQVRAVVWFEARDPVAARQRQDFRLAGTPATLAALRSAVARLTDPAHP